jgi:hypothetical protein
LGQHDCGVVTANAVIPSEVEGSRRVSLKIA